ncbi:[citrate (pro-3S)-lyase] ligase [Gluconobacter albidus]|uniref:[Citrate [pro-3S]-lyase] ligase n=1 Tax=Gluconobacter albidus TaxID=318683 RepID=A0ABQ5X147_9PROT|nr:[citrate (pro-3S)-lyase] ligase [Gluconobacter albidus]GBQ90366.1 citrate lyase synthetase [Gluconobacter albidus NBRC 3250]GLQ69548.1 [Citrate [pro-3S]-lyase] ligase [Gluconobacter albidus]
MYQNLDDISISIVSGSDLERKRKDIVDFLAAGDLRIDNQVTTFIVGAFPDDEHIVACAGLDKNVVKCVCVDKKMRGSGLSVRLGTEIVKEGLSKGYDDLFLFTKYINSRIFDGWGFKPLVEIPDVVSFMDYNPRQLDYYLDSLKSALRAGDRIGSIVMNANPFTNGHRYLVEQASKECDWVHVFLVREDVSFFSYETRLTLVREGVSDLRNVVVHEGSDYIISHATFPQYFLKKDEEITEQASAIDALMFRKYIAPSLNINVRYVGTEPTDKTTAMYNVVLNKFLKDCSYSDKKIELKEIERVKFQDTAVSASRVRRLIQEHRYREIVDLVPKSTYSYLNKLFVNKKERKSCHEN